VDVPQGATQIDGQDKYLIPGLAEMHGHIPPPNAPASEVENTLFLYVANGVTTVRGMLGWPNSLEIREQSNTGELLGPTFYMAGPSFSGQSINDPEQAVEKVRQQKAEGWDHLKIHPGLTVPEYDAMARTAHEVGIRFGGHVPAEVGLRHALEMGQETFDHLDGYNIFAGGEDGPVDEAALQEAVDLTRKAGALVVPTMMLWEYILGGVGLEALEAYPELKYMSRQTVAGWTNAVRQNTTSANFDAAAAMQEVENRMRILEALHEGGVPILMGTDSPQIFSVPGFSLIRELERMQDAGMSNYEILKTGTYNVGEYFNSRDAFGTVAVGRRADLVLLQGNPLADLQNLTRRDGVMLRGRWLPQSEIQDRLDRIAASYEAGNP
jgi:imidazolonepropionase-like amidohydrolase